MMYACVFEHVYIRAEDAYLHMPLVLEKTKIVTKLMGLLENRKTKSFELL